MNDGKSQDPAAAPPAINPSGEVATNALPEPSAATLAAGEQALAQHAAEAGTGAKQRGRPITHGKYAGRQRKRIKPSGPDRVPLGPVDNGSDSTLLEESQFAPVQIGTEAVEQEFDEEVNRKYTAIVVSGLVLFSNTVKKARIAKRTGNRELANWVIANKEIGEAPRQGMETGLLETARKHKIDLSKTPEWMLLGSFLLWQTEDAANTDALIAKYLELRPNEKTTTN